MTQPFVRVDVWDLPAGDSTLDDYANAVAAMRAKPASDPTSWAYQAAIHGTYAQNPLPLWNQCRHGSWYFICWHRMYLYYFERIVRAQVVANGGSPQWALPYWNYDGGSGHNAIPLAFRNPTRPDGSPNPLYEAQRASGINSGAGLPPSITSPAAALAAASFTGTAEFGGGVTSPLGQFWSQTGLLEQTPHNDVHVAIGGLMGDPDTAAEDPIFWLHHANIDRVWWLWEQHHSDPTDPAWANQSFDFMDVGGTPASLTGAGVEHTVSQLDYTYDHAYVRLPWPPRIWPLPWWRVRVPIRWPLPWPPGPGDPNPPDPGPEGTTLRQLIGASDRPVTLVGETARVPVAVDERTTRSLQAEPPKGGLQHRAFIEIEDIEAEKNPGTVYGVYLNLPAEPTADDLASHHVGNVSLFGVERARNPRGDEHAHGLHVSLEVTGTLHDLASKGEWKDGQQLEVTLRPITLEAPPQREELRAEIASPAHPDIPVTIGRISVHYA